ncbi:MAG: condensation domain-containing protein, partial [Bacteroidota bacterium]
SILLRNFLKTTLPDYMLPNFFVQLPEFPLTSNGKVDKRALLKRVGPSIHTGKAYLAPKNKKEKQLVEIWQSVLKVEQVGMNDDFFELGGHSIKATRLLMAYNQTFKAKLALQDVFKHSSIQSHFDLLASAKKGYQKIPKVRKAKTYPLSDAQRMIWILSQIPEGSLSYVLPTILDLKNEYDIALIEQAFFALIDRHEILRTVFRADETEDVRQVVLPTKALNFTIDHIDIREEEDQEAWIKKYVIDEDYFIPFDFENGPLFRAGFFRKSAEHYAFYFTIHHLITDAWSAKIMMRDFMKLYEALLAKTKPDLPQLRIQYKDYASWQQKELLKKENEVHKNYWMDSLSGELPPLTLPIQKPRPKIKTFNGRYLNAHLSRDLTKRLKSFSQERKGSSFMTLLTAYNAFLYRYTLQKDIIVGSPVSGRDHAETEDQAGCFINTLVLRNQVDPQATFNDFFEQIKASTTEAYAHQIYPFERLVGDLNLKRDPGRSPLFDVMLVDENTGDAFEDNGIRREEFDRIEDLGVRLAKFDLEFHFFDVEAYSIFRIRYNTDLYDRAMIDQMVRHFKQFLSEAIDYPEQKIEAINYLNPRERMQVLETFNATAVDYPKEETVLDLFQNQVKQRPQQIAVVYQEQSLTFQQLDTWSNQLAHYLNQNFTIEPNDLVGVALERSEWMLVAILSILKVGGAYVPIDPHFPEERKNYIRQDSQFKVCLDRQQIEDFRQKQSNYSTNLPITLVQTNQLAYVIYTSGSTGIPKGVLNQHDGLINRLRWMQAELHINEQDILLQKTPYTFDVSVWELLLPLITGSRLIFAAPGGH